MIDYNKQFDAAYQMLNAKQREAVDHIYGPVLTLAGPGTGKTQLLTVRIGHIVRTTDTDIRNILCLTYTDAGAHAMRKRLQSFIGPDAYNANIYTYHAFCNDIIKSNTEYFGGYRDLQSVTDLELVDVYREIIDSWGKDHPMKRFGGQLYFDKSRLEDLFSNMKKEGWTTADIQVALDGLRDYIIKEDLERAERGEKQLWHYLRKSGDNAKGDFKQSQYDKYRAKFDNLLVASESLQDYDRILAKKERFDYQDMIQWVIDAFREYPDLLADYQERFQFILVDEYQDTNGTQNELIFLLADNVVDEKPNLFVVGDDDQAIYRFQGANMKNIETFVERYQPHIIVLENNYRSYQGILDRAQRLINHNQQRIAGEGTDIEKRLIESRNLTQQTGTDPIFRQYKNVSQEEYGVVTEILKLKQEGVALDDIAVIYRSHRNVDNMVKYLTLHDIPLNIKKKVDVLKEMDVLRLLNILTYVYKEHEKTHSANHMLFEIMHYDFFELTVRDIGLVSIYCSRRTEDQYEDKKYIEVLRSEEHLRKAEVTHVDKLLQFATIIDAWVGMKPNVTMQVLFEHMLTQSGLLDQILRSEDTAWRLQVINTFFNLVKDESDKSPDFALEELMDMLAKMKEHEIALPIAKVTSSESGIHFLTNHGSKGLEFKYVFMIRCEEKNWVKKGNAFKFSYPPTLTFKAGDADEEDERRLFYVGMTRAKDRLYLSYSELSETDKDQSPCQFFTEILESEGEVEQMLVDDTGLLRYKADLMRYRQGKVEIIDHDLVDRVLARFTMSSTSLNKYLKCPVTFYFENILRIPMARTAPFGYGNAIHHSLEYFFKEIEKDPERKIPAVAVLLKYFADGMKKYHSHFTKKEYDLTLLRGEKTLTEYYEERSGSWSRPRAYHLEYSVSTEHAGVPITGKLDRVEEYDDHVAVVDYKTGKYNSGKLKPSIGGDDLGGDYWRQIIFYKMLMDGDLKYRGRMRKGTMDFVEKDGDKYKAADFEVAGFEVELVEKQLVGAYEAIKRHEFEEGCDDEKCTWCNFVKDNLSVSLPQQTEDNADRDAASEDTDGLLELSQ